MVKFMEFEFLNTIQIKLNMGKNQLAETLKTAMSHKQLSHFVGNPHTMQFIGG
jgi:hypothetical protein